MRVCSVPGCGAMQPGPRCRTHQAAQDRYQRRTVPTKIYVDRDRKRRKAAVDAHRARHGDWCPGFGRPAHAATDLTADHIVEMQEGGSPDGALGVLCRSCNSRKAQATQTRLRRGGSRG